MVEIKEEHLKTIMTDFLSDYSRNFPLNDFGYDFDFYWFRVPPAPTEDDKNMYRGGIKIYASKGRSKDISPLLVMRQVKVFPRDTRIREVFDKAWRDIFYQLITRGMDSLYREAASHRDNIGLDYPKLP